MREGETSIASWDFRASGELFKLWGGNVASAAVGKTCGVAPETDLDEVATIMKQRKIRHVPVCNGDNPTGCRGSVQDYNVGVIAADLACAIDPVLFAERATGFAVFGFAGFGFAAGWAGVSETGRNV